MPKIATAKPERRAGAESPRRQSRNKTTAPMKKALSTEGRRPVPTAQTVPSRAIKHLIDARERFAARLTSFIDRPDPKAVHDLRVASRRLVVLLDLFRKLEPSLKHSDLQTIFTMPIKATGRLSDLQVIQARLAEWGKDYPEARIVLDELAVREAAEWDGLAEWLSSADLPALPPRLEILGAALAERFGPSVDSRFVVGAERALRTGLVELDRRRKALRPDRIKTIHRLRRALRAFRYAAEFLRPFVGEAAEQAIRSAKVLQTAMGDLHDLDLLTAEIRSLSAGKADEAAEPERLLSALDGRREKDVAAFLELSGHFDAFAALAASLRDAPPRATEVLVESQTLRLILVRHGLAAARGTPGVENDELRPLLRKGRSRTREMARMLARQGIRPDLVVASPLLRTYQTAEILFEQFRPDAPLQCWDEMRPDRPAGALFERLNREIPRPATVALVGHEPNLSRLASALLTDRRRLAIDFRKSAAMMLRIDGQKLPLKAELEWFIPPRLIPRG
ncbi:MAG: CHAD domain-containing protein [Myxococcales bacterium]|nr:MAG: CHAD domain-containing protein [Myxococcales bacterium]